MELKAQIDTLQKDVAQLTEIMKEKALAAQNSEVLVLSEKLAAANKELAERKVQFSVKNSGSDFDKKAVHKVKEWIKNHQRLRKLCRRLEKTSLALLETDENMNNT